jgi:hypothetical protein
MDGGGEHCGRGALEVAIDRMLCRAAAKVMELLARKRARPIACCENRLVGRAALAAGGAVSGEERTLGGLDEVEEGWPGCCFLWCVEEEGAGCGGGKADSGVNIRSSGRARAGVFLLLTGHPTQH